MILQIPNAVNYQYKKFIHHYDVAHTQKKKMTQTPAQPEREKENETRSMVEKSWLLNFNPSFIREYPKALFHIIVARERE